MNKLININKKINNMKLVNSSGTAYASVTPYTASETPTDGNKYSFAFTLGTT